MATFDVRTRRLAEVTPHPNADRLELARVDGYFCVVPKGQFSAGDLVAYLPEASLLPAPLIEELGLTGKLSGPEQNRIKAVSLRGALSQGVVMQARPGWTEGQSVMAELGVEKFVPEIPEELQGAAYVLEEHERLDFDIENIKAFPEIIQSEEMVTLTEKVHGVFLVVGAVPEDLSRPESGHRNGRSFVSSKGLLASRMAFFQEADNPYVRAAELHGLYAVAEALATRWGVPALVMGELFGVGIQDLAYGQDVGKLEVRVFAIARKEGGQNVYVDDADLAALCAEFGLARVPVLYRGPFSGEVLATYTSGKETVSGRGAHLREGVVVTPLVERRHSELGRVVLKSISDAYLLRKGGTEYT